MKRACISVEYWRQHTHISAGQTLGAVDLSVCWCQFRVFYVVLKFQYIQYKEKHILCKPHVFSSILRGITPVWVVAKVSPPIVWCVIFCLGFRRHLSKMIRQYQWAFWTTGTFQLLCVGQIHPSIVALPGPQCPSHAWALSSKYWRETRVS